MKTLTEFVRWLDTEGQHAEIIVNWDDFSFLWSRVNPLCKIGENVLLIAGRRVRGIPPPVPKLSPEPKDVSARRLFTVP